MEINKQNGAVAFNDKQHVYWNVNDNARYISVTTLIEKFTQPFDKDFWSGYKALEKLIPKESWALEKKSLLNTMKIDMEILPIYNISINKFNEEQQNILDEWDKTNKDSCERGTKIHADLENSFYKAGKNVNLEKFGLGGKFECKKDYSDLDLNYGVYPEYLIYRESADKKLRVAGQIDLIVKNKNEITIIDHKGLPLDTPILTSVGWKTMGELKVKDKVFDKDGNLCNIITKSSVHNNPCYKITFDNSESIVADVDHRWYISFKNNNNSIIDSQVMTTLELKNYLDSSKNTPVILNTKPLKGSSELPLDPYVFGCWLGITNNKSINKPTENIKLEIINRGFKIINTVDNKEFEILNIDKILSSSEYIPSQYILSSYKDRLDLLRGIMDTIGGYDLDKKIFSVKTTEGKLLQDINTLINSLGINCFVNNSELNFITEKFNPFLITDFNINILEQNYYRNIVSVEKVDTVPTQCIAVDSDSHTYLCGRSLIVTHNTNKEIKLKSNFNVKTKTSTKMKYPLNHLDDCNFIHYSLQLSTYAWMLQQLNPDFVIKKLLLNHYDHNGKNTLIPCEYLKNDVIRMLAFYKKQSIIDSNKEKRKPIEY